MSKRRDTVSVIVLVLCTVFIGFVLGSLVTSALAKAAHDTVNFEEFHG
jgi:hypothetical protein